MRVSRHDENMPVEVVDMLRQHRPRRLSVGRSADAGHPDVAVAPGLSANRGACHLRPRLLRHPSYTAEEPQAGIVVISPAPRPSSRSSDPRLAVTMLDSEPLVVRLWIVASSTVSASRAPTREATP